MGNPWALAVDNAGNIYLGLGLHDPRIRVINQNGIINTVAGNGSPCASATAACGDGGPATSANLTQPIGVALDSQGNIYIADLSQNRIRKVTAATGVISTVVGTGVACSSTTATCGDGGAATSAQLNGPQAIAIDNMGNLYVGDTADNRVRMVSATTGNISTIIGTGTACTLSTGGCGDGSAATQAGITQPRAFAFDSSGNFYLGEGTGQRVRKYVPSTGLISTVAGLGASCSSPTATCGDGGAATSANLNRPTGIALDNAGNLYIADEYDNRIRKVTASTGVITTIAGTGAASTSGDGGDATLATLDQPAGIAVNTSGDLIIGVGASYEVQKVSFGTFGYTAVQASSATQNVMVKTTASQTISSISVPASFGSKQEYAVGTMTGCSLNSSVASGTTCTIPVTFSPAYPGPRRLPLQIVTSTGSFSFSLSGTGVGPQTSLSPGTITTIAGTATTDCSTTTAACGDGGAATSAALNQQRGNFTDALGNIWLADSADNRVRKISPGGTITTVAGTGTACSGGTAACGDGGAATSATLSNPKSVVVDSAGNLYIADSNDGRVRMVAAGTQIISAFAGTGATCSSSTAACGDGAAASSAQLNTPSGLAVDGQGNVYIADSNDNRIRMVSTSGYISTIAGTGTSCSSTTAACGDGGSALSANFNAPIAIFVDAGSNLWIADTGDNRVREMTWTSGLGPGQWIISSAAGTGAACSSGGCGDEAAATSALLNAPKGIAVDAGGNVYIADSGISRIRVVSAVTKTISTVAGTAGGNSSGDNGPATAAVMNSPKGLSLDPLGNLIIDDTYNSTLRKVNVASSAFTFASTTYDTPSSDSPQLATLSNIGNAALSFPIPNSGQNPSIANNFQLSSRSSSACPALTSSSFSPGSLPSGQNCTLTISFVPQQIGSISGSLVATDNALNSTGSTQTVALSGTATDASPAVNLVSTNNPSTYGTSITLTASLSNGCAGSVSFKDGGTLLASVNTTGSSASLTISSLTGGAHSIVASYAGNADCNSATSSTLSQTINKAPVTIAGSSSLNPSLYGDVIQFTYAFTGAASQATPTGNASLYDGSTLLSTLTLDVSGHASFASSALAARSHTLKVVYNGDTNYQ